MRAFPFQPLTSGEVAALTVIVDADLTATGSEL